MSSNFNRQVKGFFISSLKIQSRNLVILALGFLLPIALIFVFQFAVNNSFNKIRVGFDEKIVSDDYSNAIDFLSSKGKYSNDGSNEFYEMKGYGNENLLDTALLIDKVDVVLKHTGGIKSSTISVVSKDNNKLRNRLLEVTINGKLAQLTLADKKIKQPISIVPTLMPFSIGTLLLPLFPVLLALAIVICCLSMTDLNIFNSRDNLALRRMFVAPSMPSAYVIGQSLARIGYCLMQIMFVLVIMTLFFKFRMANPILVLPQIIFLTIITTVIYICQNLILSAVIKKDKNLNLINATLLLAQFALITDLLPLRQLPEAFNFIIGILPMSAFVRSVGLVASDGFTILQPEVIGSVLILLIWLGLLSFVSKRLFVTRI
jgi:ABC-2 family transporter protein